MWSEEEMRDIPDEPPVRGPRVARTTAGTLRAELAMRNVRLAAGLAHELTRGRTPAVVYGPAEASHGNFINASWQRICARPEWARRLDKAHTAGKQAQATGPDERRRRWAELDTAASSDALLMNVFCYPRVLAGRLGALLGVDARGVPEFGVRAGAGLTRGHVDRTEIDMRLGDLLVEAKLTESDFQTAPVRLLERYDRFAEVFARDGLEIGTRGVRSYQLVRGVLAADAAGARFCVLCDARRGDLVEDWFRVMGAVRLGGLRARLRLLTWQEIAASVPRPLRIFLAQKYGIMSGPAQPTL